MVLFTLSQVYSINSHIVIVVGILKGLDALTNLVLDNSIENLTCAESIISLLFVH